MEISHQYWAGLFDGEGTIYFAKDLIHMKVGVAQKEVLVLHLLRNRFGGYIRRPVPSTSCRIWEVGGKKEMVAFLEAVRPYLLIKRLETEIALEALKGWNLRNSKNGGGGRGRSMPQVELDRRRVLKDLFDSERAKEKIHSPLN